MATSNPIIIAKKPSESGDFEGHDAEQVRMMDEVCIVLDRDDNPIAQVSKRVSHIMTNINKGLLHRAFSCFVFNSKNELLLQQRDDTKVIFPGLWTNTCCSHPLDIPGERDDDFAGAIAGVLLNNFVFLTRAHYRAAKPPGESLCGLYLFLQVDVDLAVNPNEVKETRWVSPEKLRDIFKDPSLQYTPWFQLICESLLFKWWAALGTLEFDQYKGESEIRHM
ncbi:NUDIX hydrolase domain-like protein [Aspergillus caelatus]|uniref:isopentenyl-diphosphate Delta-isomerase n=1 Tax=Aspergillus caelatus TaxID=61420 RepID=A0A5N7A178_9EURO|nr:NUDIX hydrolase domain-like protein [Aspergillus caelatus]KAE8363562.1 NUDIX hydrolase domain-like protein [Aspergillus caelatus]